MSLRLPSSLVAPPEPKALLRLDFFPRGEELRVRPGDQKGWRLYRAWAVLLEMGFVALGLIEYVLVSGLIHGAQQPTPGSSPSLAASGGLLILVLAPFWFPLVALGVAFGVSRGLARYVVAGNRGVAFLDGSRWWSCNWKELRGPELSWEEGWTRWEVPGRHQGERRKRISLSWAQAQTILLHPGCPIVELAPTLREHLLLMANWVSRRSG